MKKINKYITVSLIALFSVLILLSFITTNIVGIFANISALTLSIVIYANNYKFPKLFIKPKFIKDLTLNTSLMQINDNVDRNYDDYPPLAYEFGIDKERFNYLIKEMQSIERKYTKFSNGDRIINTLNELSKITNHKNELAVMSYSLGLYITFLDNPILALGKIIKITKM